MAEEETGTDVYQTILETLIAYGIVDPDDTSGSNLATWISDQLADNVSEEQLWRDIKQRDEYKARFPAMEFFDSQFQGMTELKYIERENEYRQSIERLGLNYAGFKSTSFIGSLMSNEVSVDELTQRVNYAEQYINNNAPQSVVRALRDEFGLSNMEMVEYLLDPENDDLALSMEMENRKARAQVRGAAEDSGMNLSNRLVQELANAGVGYRNAIMGLQEVAISRETLSRLAAMEGDTFTDDELAGTSSQFQTVGSVEAKKKRSGLASRERARFSGASGIGRGSLARGGLGSQ